MFEVLRYPQLFEGDSWRYVAFRTTMDFDQSIFLELIFAHTNSLIPSYTFLFIKVIVFFIDHPGGDE